MGYKISADLDPLEAAPAVGDLLVIVDISDTTQGAAGSTKKITASYLFTDLVLTTPQINDTTADHQYVLAVSELAGDRTVTLPLLTGNDEFVFKDHTQTLTNKTLTSPTIAAGAIETSLDMNGTEFILDANGNTSITADTDDQIDVKIGGADDFKFTANTFTALSGSSIATNTISETTGASGVTIDSIILKDGNAINTTQTDHITITPGTSKLVRIAVLRQNDTTDAYENNSVILTGWGFILGGDAIGLSETVTMGVTFTSNKLTTVCSPIGFKTSDPTTVGDITTGFDSDALWAVGPQIASTTQFVARLRKETGEVFSSSNRYLYSWITIGQMA